MNLCTHPVPEHLERRITEHGGLAPNGSPLFRVIWGGDRLTIVGGEWYKHDNSGNVIGKSVEEKLCVKYPMAAERWIFEVFCPPENYGTLGRWEADTVKWIEGRRVNSMGPYPKNGEYELVKVLETPTRPPLFVPLTAALCDALIETAVLNRELPKAIRMEAFRDRQEKEARAKEQRKIDIIEARLRPSWANGPHIVLPADVTKKGEIVIT